MTMTETYFERLSQAPPRFQLQQMISSYWIASAIGVAANLGIADRLADGPKSSDELAQATGSHPRALYRLLRALAGVGIFTEVEPERFGLTPMAEALQTDAPASLYGYAVYLCNDLLWRTWSQLGYSVQTGQPAFKHLFGLDPWEYRVRHPEFAASFNAAMTGVSTQIAQAVTGAYDFSGVGTVVDVGGGHGGLLTALLRANPGLHAVLFDLPQVIKEAREPLRAAGLLERCDLVAGDMFEAVPADGDLYMLSRVIHDWDDNRAVTILANCRRVMGRHSTLLLVEEVIPPGDVPFYGKLGDLNMLVLAGGQERTEAEYRALYAAAGFTLRQIIPTRSRMSLLEGTLV
jgi:O-methyltransferase domain/Dimerisation domain